MTELDDFFDPAESGKRAAVNNAVEAHVAAGNAPAGAAGADGEPEVAGAEAGALTDPPKASVVAGEAPDADDAPSGQDADVDEPSTEVEPEPIKTANLPRSESTPAELAKTVEALLFLSPEPVGVFELAQSVEASEEQVVEAVELLTQEREECEVVVRELAGGFTLATTPSAEAAARRLLGRSRTAALTAAQAETLAVVAYLQPVSRPDIARIRGVASESATLALAERGLIEEAGRSQFGAIMYRVTPLFLKVFGLPSTDDLPDPAQWDPTPEERESLRERLLSAGDQRLESTKS